jgi:hypothetical protein
MKNEQTNLPAAGLEPGVELLLADAKRTHVDAAQTLVGEDFSERDAAAISAKKGPVRKFTALDDPERKEIEALIKRLFTTGFQRRFSDLRCGCSRMRWSPKTCCKTRFFTSGIRPRLTIPN